jgi:hypothetical protein
MTELATGHDVPVVVPITGAQADALLGTGSSNRLAAHITSIAFPFANPSTGMLAALWVEAIVRLVAVVTGMIVAAQFLFRVARGRAFERGTSTLVMVGAGIVAAVWMTHALVSAVTAPAAISQLIGQEFDFGAVAVDLTPVAWILFLAAVGMAFHMGENLRRETAGLV